MISHRNYTNSKPIEYTVPKNTLIYKNYIDTKLSPSLDYNYPHYDIGCSILYEAYLKDKSTFILKGNIIINITSNTLLEKNFNEIYIYLINGSITIDGEKYFFSRCERKYDEENNDSQIFYQKDGSTIEKYYNFNILDFLPSITD